LRWRTVSGGGQAPEPEGRKRSGRPERSGFLEGDSPWARSRAQAPKGRARRGKNLIRDGFGRTGPARRFSPAARGKWSPRQTMERQCVGQDTKSGRRQRLLMALRAPLFDQLQDNGGQTKCGRHARWVAADRQGFRRHFTRLPRARAGLCQWRERPKDGSVSARLPRASGKEPPRPVGGAAVLSEIRTRETPSSRGTMPHFRRRQ